MATELAKAHSGLAYGSVVVSVVIVAAFGCDDLCRADQPPERHGRPVRFGAGRNPRRHGNPGGQLLARLQLGSSAKNVLLANAQNNLATSVPGNLIKSAKN